MSEILKIIISSVGIRPVCWLINKISERKFCKKAGKEANQNYRALQKAKRKK
jgi:hypothetical protein